MKQNLNSIWTYPWDIVDEGVDNALRRIRDEGGLNCISLTSTYHSIKAILPHNPRRKVFFNTSGTVYFKPDISRYGRMQPLASRDVDGRDVFAEVSSKLDAYDMHLKAWTICCHTTGLGQRYPDCTLQNAFGEHFIHALDPSHPDVRKYLVGLAGDLAAHYPLEAIELESPGYMDFIHNFHHEIIGVPLAAMDRFFLSLTFSQYDCAAYEAQGGNPEMLRRRVAAYLEKVFNEDLPSGRPEASAEAVTALVNEDEELMLYMQARRQTVGSLIADIAEAVQAGPYGTQLLLFVGLDPVLGEGLHVTDVLDSIGGVFAGTYNTPPEQCAEVVAGTRAQLQGKPHQVIGSVRAIQPQAKQAAEILPKVAALRAAGVDGLNFYNYGLMRIPNLHAIREALRA